MTSNNHSHIKPARPPMIKEALAPHFACQEVLVGLARAALVAATTLGMMGCPCPSVVPKGKSTYLGLCREKNVALCVSADFGFSSASLWCAGWEMAQEGHWGRVMPASVLGHGRGRNLMHRGRNGVWGCIE